jgi:eukaryotic-like serine/threonine-protein kinase
MLIGATFGSYRVVEKLGAGGMGEVYRAHDSALQREVALKILPALATHDPTKDERLERFAREARALAALNHPHIGVIYGLESHVVAEAGTTPVTALVLELIEGETLAERIKRGPLSIAEATRLAGQIAGALEAAHEKSIVHRDLKPANVKVTTNGVVKVLDFGLAKTIAGTEQAGDGPTEIVTRQGAIVGTPAYMSPEQVRAQDVDKRTDVWAFGCVLYEMLTGHRAFSGSR